jgi:hypothetical protein
MVARTRLNVTTYVHRLPYYVMPTQRAKDIHTITAQNNIPLNILSICTFIYKKKYKPRFLIRVLHEI